MTKAFDHPVSILHSDGVVWKMHCGEYTVVYDM